MEGGCFTSVHWKMENKEHNGQEQNEGQDGMPALWYVLFYAKRLHRCM